MKLKPEISICKNISHKGGILWLLEKDVQKKELSKKHQQNKKDEEEEKLIAEVNADLVKSSF